MPIPRDQEDIPGGTPLPEEQPSAPRAPQAPGAPSSGGDTAGETDGAGGAPQDPMSMEDAGGGEEPPLPPLPPPPPANTPLAVQGSFARPGSSAANPFMTDTVMRDKARGGVREREMRFGAGSASAGAPPMDEDLLATLRAMRSKGGVR